MVKNKALGGNKSPFNILMDWHLQQLPLFGFNQISKEPLGF